jgi:arylformamidase
MRPRAPFGSSSMCDHCPAPSLLHSRWKGWTEIPRPTAHAAPAGDGLWTDLTHVLTEELSRASSFPQPTIRQIVTIPDAPINLTELHMVAHHGTHVDAPRHFIPDGPTFEQIPLERLYGPAVVWRLENGEYGEIDVADLEAARPRVHRGDMALLDTGWAQYINTPRYEDHGHLTAAAAQWLVDQGVKLLGVDFSTPDLTTRRRPEGFDWPVHQILLSHGVLVAEHLTNLRGLANQRVEALFLALPIQGSDGAPARVLARAVVDNDPPVLSPGKC